MEQESTPEELKRLIAGPHREGRKEEAASLEYDALVST